MTTSWHCIQPTLRHQYNKRYTFSCAHAEDGTAPTLQAAAIISFSCCHFFMSNGALVDGRTRFRWTARDRTNENGLSTIHRGAAPTHQLVGLAGWSCTKPPQYFFIIMTTRRPPLEQIVVQNIASSNVNVGASDQLSYDCQTIAIEN